MTIALDTSTSTLLRDSGALLLEIGPDDLGENFEAFLGCRLQATGEQLVLVLPVGQDPEVRDRIVRQLLQMPGGRS
jgi:hypothetical protein